VPDVSASPNWEPETQYARSGDVHIAYQTWGEGAVTMVGVPGIVNNVELWWQEPETRRYFLALGSFCRFVFYDKRGQGLSDRDTGVPTLDERLQDLAAVIDAVGAERVALGGISEGGATAAMFAATFPERVSHLVLFGAFARPDQVAGDALMPRWAERWGTPRTPGAKLIAPSKAHDPEFVRWVNRVERQTTTPAGLLASWAWVREIDVRPVLSSIQCPTLVLHRKGDAMIPIEEGRYLAEHIPGARCVELEGDSHLPQWGGWELPVALVEEHVTGHSSHRRTERVLATVLFTDIVDSTARAVASGDAAWRRLLDRHDQICRATVARYEGRWVKQTGDGVLVTFDTPGVALDCAQALRGQLSAAGVSIRAGLHTGEIELRDNDVAGIGVHIASRISSLAGSGEVLASRVVKDLVAGSGHLFTGRGVHALRGVPDQWEIVAVEPDRVAAGAAPAGAS
jgi:pimeloyl-ACP methyl ester carboxylesterase/class 3 adenylate cyclase